MVLCDVPHRPESRSSLTASQSVNSSQSDSSRTKKSPRAAFAARTFVKRRGRAFAAFADGDSFGVDSDPCEVRERSLIMKVRTEEDEFVCTANAPPASF
jgi:hypothetical protein